MLFGLVESKMVIMCAIYPAVWSTLKLVVVVMSNNLMVSPSFRIWKAYMPRRYLATDPFKTHAMRWHEMTWHDMKEMILHSMSHNWPVKYAYQSMMSSNMTWWPSWDICQLRDMACNVTCIAFKQGNCLFKTSSLAVLWNDAHDMKRHDVEWSMSMRISQNGTHRYLHQ